MAPPNWLHCNKCYTRYNDGIKFFITECCHTVCENCAKIMGMSNAKCVVCKTGTSLLHLSKDLLPDILDYFQPLNVFMDKTNKIVRFQMWNINMLLKNLIGKYNFAKAELMKSYKQNHMLKIENAKLKSMLMAKRDAPHFSTSTPIVKVRRPHQNENRNSTMFSVDSSPGPGAYSAFCESMMGYKANPVGRNHVVPVHSNISANDNSSIGSLSLAQMSLANLMGGYAASSTSNN